jgi:hypothetical protein
LTPVLLQQHPDQQGEPVGAHTVVSSGLGGERPCGNAFDPHIVVSTCSEA